MQANCSELTYCFILRKSLFRCITAGVSSHCRLPRSMSSRVFLFSHTTIALNKESNFSRASEVWAFYLIACPSTTSQTVDVTHTHFRQAWLKKWRGLLSFVCVCVCLYRMRHDLLFQGQRSSVLPVCPLREPSVNQAKCQTPLSSHGCPLTHTHTHKLTELWGMSGMCVSFAAQTHGHTHIGKQTQREI